MREYTNTDRASGTFEHAGRFGVRPAFQVAEDHNRAILLGQTIDLLMQSGRSPPVAPGGNRGFLNFHKLAFSLALPGRVCLGPYGDPPSHAEEPRAERLAAGGSNSPFVPGSRKSPERRPRPHANRPKRLGRPSRPSDHDSPQGCKCRLGCRCLLREELLQKLAVCHSGGRASAKKGLERPENRTFAPASHSLALFITIVLPYKVQTGSICFHPFGNSPRGFLPNGYHRIYLTVSS